MIKAIFWDIDGTLLETENLHYSQVCKACAPKGIRIENREIAGMSDQEIWKNLKLYDYFPSYKAWSDLVYCGYDKAVNPSLVREGIVEILSFFQEKKITQIAVSNGTRYMVDINLKNTNLLSFFQKTISCDDVENPKPFPDPYRKAIEHCQISPREGIAIEDTQIGFQAAKAAGLVCVVFSNPQSPMFDSNVLDYVIDHPSELIPILEGFQREKVFF